ncbi:unnamed protein product [Vicia faba]|uniref:Uncharacterized protein n=1 Tax=Vicia faba TaxID=3906 RepID=A0AAV0ZSB6_VICFA|nr:unnamed protein product [Vicia faba]
MVVVDKDGSDIHVKVLNVIVKVYDFVIIVNNTFSDKNKHEIPPKPLQFKPFADIVTGKWKSNVLIDVIGLVSEIGYTQLQSESKKQQINLVLKDLSNHCLNCTLWEGYTMQFNEYNNGQGVRKFSIIIPQLILEEYSSQTLTSQTHSSTQAFGSSHITPYDKLMYKAIVLPLAEIVKFQAACHKCPMVVRGSQPSFVCGSGHKTETQIFEYKILIEAVYHGAKATFVIWDREAFQLLKLTAAQMRNNMLEAVITDPLKFPLALDALVDETLKKNLEHSFGEDLDMEITSYSLSELVTPTLASKRIVPHCSNELSALSRC